MRFFAGLALLSAFAAGPAARADDAAPAERTVSGLVVDEAGRPVSGVAVELVPAEGPPVPVGDTADDGTFRFTVPVDESVRVRAVDPTTPRLGSGLSRRPREDGKAGPDETSAADRIVLKPARRIVVRVSDDAGAAVEGATAEVLWSGGAGGGNRIIFPTFGPTDRDGKAAFLLPATASVETVIAFKPGAGFDYLDDSPDSRGRPVTELPEEVPLRLDGATTVRVRVVGDDGSPLPGSPVQPWYVHKKGYRGDANVSGARTVAAESGADGVATFDWLPAGVERGIPFLDRALGDRHAPDWVSTDPKKPGAELTMRLLARVGVTGRVTLPDGTPARGVGVTAQGSGHAHFEDEQIGGTDADGKYTLRLAPEQAYVVTAGGREWASESRVVSVLAGRPVEGVDFSLRQPTVIRGTVTLGPEKRPVPEASLQLHRDAGLLPDEIQRLAKDGSRRGLGSFFHARTDAEGRYEFKVGPGEYTLSGPPHAGRAEFTLTDEPEVVHDFHMEREATGPLAVRVVGPDGKAVAKAKVNGTYASSEARRSFRQQITDAEGRFETTRSIDPLVIHAATADGALAGIARSEAEETEATVTLGPTATASGRALDHEGNPLAMKELRFGVRVYMGDPKKSPFTDAFGGTAATDAEGRYTLPALIVGQTYHVSHYEPPYYRRIADVKVESPGAMDLGETKLAPPPQPYVPPTPEKRLADALAAKADVTLAERIDGLLAEAGREYTRPLILFAKPDDPAAVELYRLFYEEREAAAEEGDEAAERSKTPRELRWEFELAALDMTKPGVPEFGGWIGVKSGDGAPSVLATTDVGESYSATFPLALGEDGKLDRDALAVFLASQKLPPRDAERMLAEAFAKAKAEDKRVFLVASASWCGPCRMLSRFLDPFKPDLEQHFVFVKLDVSRDEHGGDVSSRHRKEREGGVPWFVILDAEGNELSASNMPDTAPEFAGENIGFPSEPACEAYFLGMLRAAAPRLDEATLAAMKAAFEKD